MPLTEIKPRATTVLAADLHQRGVGVTFDARAVLAVGEARGELVGERRRTEAAMEHTLVRG